MVFTEAPKGFNPRFHVVTCWIEHTGKVLFVQRNEDKTEGGKWGVPGGKVEQGETDRAALARELMEEIGLGASEEKLKHLTKAFVRFPGYDFEFSMFSLRLDCGHEVILNRREHQAYKWGTLEEGLSMYLIKDNDVCLKIMAEFHKRYDAS